MWHGALQWNKHGELRTICAWCKESQEEVIADLHRRAANEGWTPPKWWQWWRRGELSVWYRRST